MLREHSVFGTGTRNTGPHPTAPASPMAVLVKETRQNQVTDELTFKARLDPVQAGHSAISGRVSRCESGPICLEEDTKFMHLAARQSPSETSDSPLRAGRQHAAIATSASALQPFTCGKSHVTSR